MIICPLNRSVSVRKLTQDCFTLIELLVVIAIIGILAALLLPVLSKAKLAAQKRQATIEISQIVAAIQQYNAVYGRFPLSKLADRALNESVTFGGVFKDAAGQPYPYPEITQWDWATNGSEIIAILMDFTNYPNGIGVTSNADHTLNPQRTVFLSARMSGWEPLQSNSPPQGGVGSDLIYRDPWGNPYVITMNLKYTEQCCDDFYKITQVSSPLAGPNLNPGLNGLSNPDGTVDNYRYRGEVMVWSAGPDGRVDPHFPANQSVNKDNILSWVQ